MQNLTSSLWIWVSRSLNELMYEFQKIFYCNEVELIKSNWVFKRESMSLFHLVTSYPKAIASSGVTRSGLFRYFSVYFFWMIYLIFGWTIILTSGTVTISWHWAKLKLSSLTFLIILLKVFLSEVDFFSKSFLYSPSKGIINLLMYWYETLSGSD